MRPEQTLDMKRDLLHVAQGAGGQLYLEAHCALVMDLHGNPRALPSGGVDDKKLTERARRSGTTLARALPVAIQTSEAFFCSEDLGFLVEHVANHLDGTDQFRVDMLPAESGFVYFDRPLHTVDMRGRSQLIHTAVWHKMSTNLGAGVIVHFFNDAVREPDDISKEIRARLDALSPAERGIITAMGRWGHIDVEWIGDHSRLGPAEIVPLDKVAGELAEQGVEPVPSTNPVRLLAAFFMLLRQTLAIKEDAELDRNTRKRARRMNIPDRVTIIRLRRPDHHPDYGGESLVEWSHRWAVRGHMAWRRCGVHHPFAEMDPAGGWRVRVYINPYIKGPEDKPLVITDKVNALVR